MFRLREASPSLLLDVLQIDALRLEGVEPGDQRTQKLVPTQPRAMPIPTRAITTMR